MISLLHVWGQREVGIAGVFVGQLVAKIISRKRLKSFMVPGIRQETRNLHIYRLHLNTRAPVPPPSTRDTSSSVVWKTLITHLCPTFSLFYVNSSKLPAGYSNSEKQVYLRIVRVGTALRGTARKFVSADKTGAVGAEAVEKKKKKAPKEISA